MDKMLFVKDLSVHYNTQNSEVIALNNASFNLRSGKNLGIAGESGSGKTSLALSLLGLIEEPHKVTGEINYNGVDFQKLSNKEKKDFRWKKVAMVFQNSGDVLNPLIKIGKQITEPLKESMDLSDDEAEKEASSLLKTVGLDPLWANAYPHQLSGGMRQKVLLAMAIVCKPDYLILDEPTSSLDSISRREFVFLIKRLQKELEFSMIVISHDLSLIKELTEKVMVLYNGNIVERGNTKKVLEDPLHPYTRGLINASIEVYPYKDLWGIPGEITKIENNTGCPFAPRCTQSMELCRNNFPVLTRIDDDREVACNQGGIINVLSAKNINKVFYIKDKQIIAVNNVSFSVKHGETMALLGKSGSGKSTLAQIVAGFTEADNGSINFNKGVISSDKPSCCEGGVQLVLQDPFLSISHRLTVRDVIAEPLRINKLCNNNEEEIIERVKEALRDVQLPDDHNFLDRFCSALSGGQRQRIAIARGLIMKPKLLIADEITSMLDVSTQANLMRLLKGIQNSLGFAMLFITHDLQLARKISERIIVLEQGAVIAEGSASIITEEMAKGTGSTKELMMAGLN